MNTLSRKAWLALLACSVSLTSSYGVRAEESKPAAEKNAQPKISLDTVIAKVNGKSIKMLDLVQLLQELPPQIQQVPMEQLFPRLRSQLVDTVLMRESAKKMKLGESKEVKKTLEKAMERALVQAYMMKVIQERVTEPSVKEAYDKYAKEFKSEKEARARHILVKEEDKAKKIIEDLKKGGDFAKLAQENSIDPSSAKDGGDLGFFARGDMVSAFSDVAFNLKPGSYTETPVKTEFGYHVIRLEEFRDSKVEPFEKKKDELANGLSQEAIMKALETLRSGAKVELFDEKGQPAAESKGAKKEAGPRASK